LEQALADATTTLNSLIAPEVGAAADTWGGKLNDDHASNDKLLGAINTGGSSNAYTLTTGQTLSALASGQAFRVRWNHASTGAATIDVDTIGAVAITKNGTTAIASGDLAQNSYDTSVFDGTQFRVIGVKSGLYEPTDADLTAIAALGYTSGSYLIKKTAAATYSLITLGAAAESIFDDASTAAILATLGAAALAWATFTGDVSVSKTIPIITANYAAGNYGGFKISEGGSLKSLIYYNGSRLVFATSSLDPGLTYEDGGDLRVVVNPTTQATNSVGLRGLLVEGTTGIVDNYTLDLENNGGAIIMVANSKTITIPPNSDVPFPIGAAIHLVSYPGNSGLSVAEGSGVTLNRADGVSGTGTRGVTAGAGVTAIKQNTNNWILEGSIAS
jgi:hypothetical protein